MKKIMLLTGLISLAASSVYAGNIESVLFRQNAKVYLQPDAQEQSITPFFEIHNFTGSFERSGTLNDPYRSKSTMGITYSKIGMAYLYGINSKTSLGANISWADQKNSLESRNTMAGQTQKSNSKMDGQAGLNDIELMGQFSDKKFIKNSEFTLGLSLFLSPEPNQSEELDRDEGLTNRDTNQFSGGHSLQPRAAFFREMGLARVGARSGYLLNGTSKSEIKYDDGSTYKSESTGGNIFDLDLVLERPVVASLYGVFLGYRNYSKFFNKGEGEGRDSNKIPDFYRAGAYGRVAITPAVRLNTSLAYTVSAWDNETDDEGNKTSILYKSLSAQLGLIMAF